MNSDEWKGFVDKIKDTVESNPDLDEANTKSRIINPLLKKLGWDPLEGDVRAEYPVKFATRTSHVDYALMVEGSPAVFVEAKALRSDINSGHAKQLIDYGRHKGVNWCVLTNGKELRVYNSAWLDPEEESTQEALVEALGVDEFVDNLDIIEKISKESITSGKTGQAFERIKQTNDTIDNLENNRQEIEENIEGLLDSYVCELVKDKVSQATSHFIKGLIDELSEYPQTITPQPEPDTDDKQKLERPEIDIDLPMMSRSQLKEKYEEGTVMVTPSSPETVDEETGLPSGVGFFKEYSAWGFVRIGATRDIDYLALYVTSPESAVKYFGKVEDIVDPRDPKSPVKEHIEKKEQIVDSWNLEEGKKVAVLEKDSLVELTDPIEGTVPLQSFWYTSFERFVKAEVTGDLRS
ncbi:type I restriction enzyme HsdR N-terminal domain-containing protein [Candidatus Bipolaricaulota bacterium]|nr:type I restriction enzyme HsdR N-terminal domain-containing protein [Candidatus Bipolaricaulota bacterium]